MFYLSPFYYMLWTPFLFVSLSFPTLEVCLRPNPPIRSSSIPNICLEEFLPVFGSGLLASISQLEHSVVSERQLESVVFVTSFGDVRQAQSAWSKVLCQLLGFFHTCFFMRPIIILFAASTCPFS